MRNADDSALLAASKSPAAAVAMSFRTVVFILDFHIEFLRARFSAWRALFSADLFLPGKAATSGANSTIARARIQGAVE